MKSESEELEVRTKHTLNSGDPNVQMQASRYGKPAQSYQKIKAKVPSILLIHQSRKTSSPNKRSRCYACGVRFREFKSVLVYRNFDN
jgi:calcineurin-like phosphoesterase family protein